MNADEHGFFVSRPSTIFRTYGVNKGAEARRKKLLSCDCVYGKKSAQKESGKPAQEN